MKVNKNKGGSSTGRSNHSMNPNRKADSVKGGSVRSVGTIKRLQMYRNSKARHNAKGEVIKPAPFQSYVECGTRARVEPSRSWFSNSKTISQDHLQKYNDKLAQVKKDPYTVVLKKSVLPVTLLAEKGKAKPSSRIRNGIFFFHLRQKSHS